MIPNGQDGTVEEKKVLEQPSLCEGAIGFGWDPLQALLVWDKWFLDVFGIFWIISESRASFGNPSFHRFKLIPSPVNVLLKYLSVDLVP